MSYSAVGRIYARKAYQPVIHDLDDQSRIVRGVFNKMEVVDSDNDLIVKGAFLKSIKERGPKGANLIAHLQDHDTTKAIGRILELDEVGDELVYTSKLGDHSRGEDAYRMIKAGIMKFHSIGFTVPAGKYEKGEKYNVIKEAKMYEGSSLQFLPANIYTPVLDVKSANKETIIKDRFDRLQTLTKAYKNGDFHDETFALIEIEIKQIEQYLLDALTVQPGFPTEPTEPEPSTRKDQGVDLLTLFKTTLTPQKEETAWKELLKANC